jgi:hypothetical protein
VRFLNLWLWAALLGFLSLLLLRLLRGSSAEPAAAVFVLAIAGMNPLAKPFLTTGMSGRALGELAALTGIGFAAAWLAAKAAAPLARLHPWAVPLAGCLLLTACGTNGSQKAPTPPPQSGVPVMASATTDAAVNPNMTAEQWLNLSLAAYRGGHFLECIGAAQTAIRLKPDYAPAWNNIAAAYSSLHLYDLAIPAAQEALRLDPSSTLARNNLNWAVEQKRLAAKP